MKKWSVVIGVAVLSCAFILYFNAQAADTPEKGIVIGEVIEMTSYVMLGGDSENYPATAKSRAEHGFPLAIIEEETGELWIPAYRHSAPASHLKLANPQLTELVGKVAVLQGLKYRGDKMNVIRFSVASEY